jgi:hypothetical protein
MNWRFTILSACLLALAGCSQGKGESCQIDDDCEGSLICCKTNPLAIVTERGVCMTPEACENRDTSTTDTASDSTGDTETPDVTDDDAGDPGEDTVVEDTFVEDTFVEDTFVEDTFVEDTTPDTAEDPETDG